MPSLNAGLSYGTGLSFMPGLGGPGFTQVTYLPQSNALFAKMTTPPTEARKAIINTLINTLIDAGIWAKLDAMWVLAAANSQAALLNWKNPGTFTALAVSSPTFAANQGYTGNGTSSYVNAVWNPFVNAVNYTLNSAHLGIWIRTTSVASENTTDAGVSAGLRMDTRRVTNTFLGRVNNTNNISVANSTAGYFCINRSASNAVQVRKNNTSLTTSVEASTSISNASLAILALAAATNLSTKQVSACHVGGSMTTGEIDIMYAALDAYMTAVAA